MDLEYTKVGQSWHIVDPSDLEKTLCGRTIRSDVRETLPAGKSCEVCARVLLWREDPAQR